MKNAIKALRNKNNQAKFGVFILGSVVNAAAFAQAAGGGGLGGLNKANSTAETIKLGIYALVGVLAAIYLIWLAAMAFTEKKSWSDFGWGVVYTSLAGATVALAGWGYGLFA